MLKDIEDVAKFWHGKKRNVLFAGPTGCGKTEIWRVLSQLYPNIQIVDGTMLTMEGWSGAFKLRDIFANMSRNRRKVPLSSSTSSINCVNQSTAQAEITTVLQ